MHVELTYFMNSGSQRGYKTLHDPVVHACCVVVKLGIEAKSLCDLEVCEGQGFVRLHGTKIREGS